jgi:uncharacterized Zn-binding protein involved in type VI secretion
MPFVAKIGDVVLDRGLIVGPGHINVRINGIPLAKVWDEVAPHGCCPAPSCEIHCAAFLGLGYEVPNVLVNGQPIIVQGDLATCLDPITFSPLPTPIFAGIL